MEKDQKIINKFLELFPDELADRVFNMLQSNWIQDNDNEWLESYLHHIKRFGPSFDNKILESNHSKFYEALNTLKQFMWKSFSRLNSKSNQIVLYPDVKKNNPELYKKSVNELRNLLEDTEEKYNVLRKSIEEYQLDNRFGNKPKELEIEEQIEIKNLDIIIERNNYISRKGKKFKINATDQSLIHSLHYRFMDEKGRCVNVKVLAKELGSKEKYIVNRISYINKGIKELLKDVRGPNSNIDSFIKNKKERGYHLNPRFVTEFSKKKDK